MRARGVVCFQESVEKGKDIRLCVIGSEEVGLVCEVRFIDEPNMYPKGPFRATPHPGTPPQPYTKNHSSSFFVNFATVLHKAEGGLGHVHVFLPCR